MGRGKGHVPIRTCISCKARRNKKELIRLVLNAQGQVIIDDRGNGQGRGVYVCRGKSCLSALEKRNLLSRAFRKNAVMAVNKTIIPQ
ncbi:MAG: hypothetical protein B1H11_06660 [Desulfobacteraceae bacterium 4484_190.1]|nr:MAG: hypothetical protein B1H11_06660 [Desulfobacteraceae bacterium 4484_190.1]